MALLLSFHRSCSLRVSALRWGWARRGSLPRLAHGSQTGRGERWHGVGSAASHCSSGARKRLHAGPRRVLEELAVAASWASAGLQSFTCGDHGLRVSP